MPPWPKDHAASRHPGASTRSRAGMSSVTTTGRRWPTLLAGDRNRGAAGEGAHGGRGEADRRQHRAAAGAARQGRATRIAVRHAHRLCICARGRVWRVIALDVWSTRPLEKWFDRAVRLLICIPFWGPALWLLLTGDAIERMTTGVTFVLSFAIFFWWWHRPYRALAAVSPAMTAAGREKVRITAQGSVPRFQCQTVPARPPASATTPRSAARSILPRLPQLCPHSGRFSDATSRTAGRLLMVANHTIGAVN
jgi:hypothetical protein